jgi:hypothetical protein
MFDDELAGAMVRRGMIDVDFFARAHWYLGLPWDRATEIAVGLAITLPPSPPSRSAGTNASGRAAFTATISSPLDPGELMHFVHALSKSFGNEDVFLARVHAPEVHATEYAFEPARGGPPRKLTRAVLRVLAPIEALRELHDRWVRDPAGVRAELGTFVLQMTEPLSRDPQPDDDGEPKRRTPASLVGRVGEGVMRLRPAHLVGASISLLGTALALNDWPKLGFTVIVLGVLVIVFGTGRDPPGADPPRPPPRPPPPPSRPPEREPTGDHEPERLPERVQ